MQQRTKRNITPLLVTEIILPEKQEPVKPFVDVQKMEIVTGGCVSRKIGNHEVKPIQELTILKKAPQEHYFDGTKPKKHTKKRSKPKTNCSLEEFDEPQADPQLPTEKTPTLEELIEKSKCQQQVKQYEKMKQHYDRKNQIKQRKAEKAYIKQQENLVNTWLLKKRKATSRITASPHKQDIPAKKTDVKIIEKGVSDLAFIDL